MTNKKTYSDYLEENEKTNGLISIIQKSLPKDCEGHILGMAAQKIASVCTIKLGMDLETFIEASAYAFIDCKNEIEERGMTNNKDGEK